MTNRTNTRCKLTSSCRCFVCRKSMADVEPHGLCSSPDCHAEPDPGGWCDGHRPVGFQDADGWTWTEKGWAEP